MQGRAKSAGSRARQARENIKFCGIVITMKTGTLCLVTDGTRILLGMKIEADVYYKDFSNDMLEDFKWRARSGARGDENFR